MSFFRNRSGGSLFRFRAIKGYIKILFNRKDVDKERELRNTMKAQYTVESSEHLMLQAEVEEQTVKLDWHFEQKQ